MKARHIVSALISLAAVSAAVFMGTSGRTGECAADVPVITIRAAVPAGSVTESAREQQREPPARLEGGPITQTEKDAYLLMKIAMAEAEGEDVEGKALVMRVVLNRVRSGSFPDTVEAVIFQKNQFSPVIDGRFHRAEPDDSCRAALGLVKTGWDGSGGALYFESKSDSTWHADNLRFLFRHGAHYFYTNR